MHVLQDIEEWFMWMEGILIIIYEQKYCKVMLALNVKVTMTLTLVKCYINIYMLSGM